MLTYVCSDESETFFSAFSHVTSTSLTDSNCPHTNKHNAVKGAAKNHATDHFFTSIQHKTGHFKDGK